MWYLPRIEIESFLSFADLEHSFTFPVDLLIVFYFPSDVNDPFFSLHLEYAERMLFLGFDSSRWFLELFVVCMGLVGLLFL